MKPFLDQDFLLSTDTAKKLYHDYASKMPIIDYHCHINPKEIAQDKTYENLTQVWLGGDHYKWRLMRAYGVEEQYITGNASDKEKFMKWAETLSKSIGNPIYHWSHLELQRYFNYYGALNTKTAEEVWNLCNEKLKQPSMSARNIIKQSNVTLLCTTDDPIDTLEWHKAIADDPTFETKVLPTWRPDKAMNLENDTFLPYIDTLSKITNITIDSYTTLQVALMHRLEHFNSMGCKISDHGMDYIMYEPTSEETLEAIFAKRLQNEPLSKIEILQFKTGIILFLGSAYYQLGWAMQLHYGCKRNNNTHAYQTLGPDTGFDCILNNAPSSQLADFLDALNLKGQLPRTIVYSLNPIDNAMIDTVIGCFQDGSVSNKIQHGSAWWFNDHKTGMQEHLISLANLGYLPGFIGMLTDSRSFLSYPRHEYFRRILCELIGTWVENGEYPEDYDLLSEIVNDIAYNNALNYFQFSIE